MWFIAGICAALTAALVWLLGFRYVALGDSLAAGVGSLTLYGYVPRLAAALLRLLRRPVRTSNLARFGLTSEQLLTLLRTDRRMRRAVARARLITLNIGGNDLLACRYQEDCLQEAVPRFTTNWEAILAEIRSLNPTTPLLTMTLYNPMPLGDIRRPPVAAFLEQANAVITRPDLTRRFQVAVASVNRAFCSRECELTWFCRFGDIHATDAGHQVMADRLLEVYPSRKRRGVEEEMRHSGAKA